MATPLWLLLELQRRLIGVEDPETLRSALRPGPLVRRCIAGLALPEFLASADERSEPGLKHLLLWLCAPGPAAALAEVFRFVVPGAPEFLNDGYDPERLPRAGQRVRIGARRAVSLGRILGHQVRCLLPGRAADSC